MISQRRTTAGRAYLVLVSWMFVLVLSHLVPAHGPAMARTDLRQPTALAAVSANDSIACGAATQPCPFEPADADPALPAELDEAGHERSGETGQTPQAAALGSSTFIHQLVPCAGARTDTRQPSASRTACAVRDFRGPPSA